MTSRPLARLSKLLSLMLRHEPGTFGLTLDAEGYAPVAEVVMAARTRLPAVSEADVIAVVETVEADKRRFSIVDDEIRANYGHSFADRIAQAARTPPAKLWHGTHLNAIERILREGLAPMKRQYVHLTTSESIATRVGARRGQAVLLEVDAAAAHAAGVVFYQANESFWLADSVPARFLGRHSR